MNKFLEITADGQDMAAMLRLLLGHGYQASDVTDEISESADALLWQGTDSGKELQTRKIRIGEQQNDW